MKSKGSILITLVAVLLSFIAFHLLKGSLTGIELVDSKFFYIGNIISIGTYILMLIGIILLYFQYRGVKSQNKKNVQLLSYVILLPLFIIFIFLHFEISFPGIYLFGFQFERIVISSLFVFYELLIIYLTFLVWGILFKGGFRMYLYATILSVVALASFFVLVFLYSLNYSESSMEEIKNEKNLAFVLGAAVWQHDKPSPIFKGRIEKSYELYNKRIVNKIQVTGGNAPGELSEAKTAYNFLLSKGVDAIDVLTEENSSNTLQQIQFLWKNEVDYRKKFTNIILISDEFHMIRILELCKYYDLKVVTLKSDYELSMEKLLFYRIRESVALFLFWLFGI